MVSKFKQLCLESQKSQFNFYHNPNSEYFYPKLYGLNLSLTLNSPLKLTLTLILNVILNLFFFLETIDWWTSNQVSVVMSVISIIYPDLGFNFLLYSF